jgi:hypothetical protein
MNETEKAIFQNCIRDWFRRCLTAVLLDICAVAALAAVMAAAYFQYPGKFMGILAACTVILFSAFFFLHSVCPFARVLMDREKYMRVENGTVDAVYEIPVYSRTGEITWQKISYGVRMDNGGTFLAYAVDEHGKTDRKSRKFQSGDRVLTLQIDRGQRRLFPAETADTQKKEDFS